jgi:hypothetical protein
MSIRLFSRLLSRREALAGFALLAFLALTRSGITRTHFGDHFSLPDASWAMFWLTGLLTTRLLWPVLLMSACAVIDYYVIAHGVSAYCFTPAYPFLIPAYGSLWWLGRQAELPAHGADWLRVAASITAGVVLCFVVSNSGFYLASGYFAKMPVMLYAKAVLRYLPHYLWQTALYAGSGVLLVHCLKAMRASDAAHANLRP